MEMMIPLRLNLQQVEKSQNNNLINQKKGMPILFGVRITSTIPKMQTQLSNCALHCSRHILIANNSSQLHGFQALIILYILPSNEELKPLQEK